MSKITRRPTAGGTSGAFVGYGSNYVTPSPKVPGLKTGKTYPYASAKRGVLPPIMANSITDPEERKQAARAIHEKLRSLGRKDT